MTASRIAAASPAVIADAAARLAAGGLVAFPTETVYGLGADAGNPAAVRAIFAAKGRPADHPVIVHVADVAAVAHWTRDVGDEARRLADAFWPGPLTLILPRAAHVDDAVTGGQASVGIRMPSHPVARALLAAFAARGGHGVAAPSANRFGRISPTTARHVADDLGDRVPLIVDGGACEVGIESTIVAFVAGEPVLLRPGGIGRDALARVLGRPVLEHAGEAPRASGTLASHYAPRTPARLVPAASLVAAAGRTGARVAVLSRTVPAPAAARGPWLVGAPLPDAYAHDLYAHLRTLDASGAEEILIEALPGDDTWAAVRDRLARATHGVDDDRD